MTIAPGFRAAAAASLFLLVACAQDGEAATAPGDAPARRDPDAVVLRVDHTGGFLTPADNVARLPVVTVYGDGRAIVNGPVPGIYPGPALPNLQMIDISPAEVDKLVARATAAGVGTATDFGRPPVADLPSTRFTVHTEGGPLTTEVYALGHTAGDEDASLTAGQKAARAKLSELLAAVSFDLPTTVGVPPGSQRPYEPAALAAVATPYVAPEGRTKEPGIAWPGPALPGTPVGEGLETGCVTVSGAGTAKVLAAAGKANAATPWTSGGRKWTVVIRPLLPDEADCAALLTR